MKYSDYAVGRFIEMVRTKSWLKDAVFVLVADPCASSKGRVSLPPENHHIPAIVYSPAHLAPHTDTRLASQIDPVPSTLDLLGLPEHTRFIGLLNAYPDAGRAFIATCQNWVSDTRPAGRTEPRPQDRGLATGAQHKPAAAVRQPGTQVARAIDAYP